MDLRNCRFGLLTSLKPTVKGKRVAWECVCDCGNTKVVAQVELRSGDTRSCGCLKKHTLLKRNTSHGACGTAVYGKWRGMWHRVRSTHLTRNKCYKGVSVCEAWRRFENFYADMGDPPDGYSLDRIDNTKGYSPSNCRWVPLQEQARNTRRLRTHNGVSMSQAARAAGLAPDIVFDRINKLGWDIERALSTPLRQRTVKRNTNKGQHGHH
jgi:hypothetical protein